jgi:Ca2+-binding RTX toxin-like protein
MTAGADSIEGGATGTDTITLTATNTDVDGTATGDNSTGVAINLGATAVDEATVLGAVTRHMGEGTTQVGVGKATFLFTAANATTVGQVNADVLQTIGGIENINGGSGNDYIIATSGNNVVNGGDGVDYISMGDGNDTLLVTAITDIENAGNNAIEDTIVGGNGTDKIAFNGGVSLLVGHDFTDNVTGFSELVSNGAQATAISLVTHATFQSDTGIQIIDLSADTNTAGSNTIDISNQSTTAAMTLTGSAGVDTITLDAGSADVVKGGLGLDVLDFSGGTAADSLDVTLANTTGNFDTVANFVVATDLIRLDATATTVATASGAAAAVEDEAAAAANTNGNAYGLAALLTLNTNAVDLVTLDSTVLTNLTKADLDAAGTINNGTELLKAIVSSGTGNTASGITVDNAGDQFYILTDDGTDSYLYHANSGADTTVSAAEIILVADFGGATIDGINAASITIA